MAEIALRELIDEKRLQHLQNEFCKVTGVMAVCVDKEGRAITEPYIDKSLIRPDGEDPIVGEYRRKAAQALDRVQEGSLEEQVVEELPDGGHLLPPACEHLVWVALMAHVKDQPVPAGVEHPVDGHGELHHPQVGGQMPSGPGYVPDQLLPELAAQLPGLLVPHPRQDGAI